MQQNPSRGASILSWICQGIAAVILAQTLYFKFSGAAESRWIFSQLGVEPYGRIALAVVECVAVALLLTPGLVSLGAMMSVGILAGALGSHLFVLGIEIQGDGGLLFGLACVALLAALLVLFLRRAQWRPWRERWLPKDSSATPRKP